MPDLRFINWTAFYGSANVYVIKTADKLNFYDDIIDLPQTADLNTKVAVYTDRVTTIVPGINRITVTSELSNEILTTNYSEQNHAGGITII